MDPVSDALIGWLVDQVASKGKSLVTGFWQRRALHRIVRAAVESAVDQVVPELARAGVRNALLNPSADTADVGLVDVVDLRDALTKRVLPGLQAAGKVDVDPHRLVDALLTEIRRGIKTDAVKGGALKPVADFLRDEEAAEARRMLVAQQAAALGGVWDSVIDHRVLFDQLGLVQPGKNGSGSAPYRAPFTGRMWLLSQLDDFLRASRRGYVLLEGDAGVGKTSFALWLAAERDYVCHFTRVAPGGVATAVRNLSAQLITRLRLDDLAPGGVMPHAAGRPEWLYRVIAAAAAKQRTEHPGIPLVVVVDSLDDSDSLSGPPLGLPATLPDGVFVVATMLTGTPVHWLGQESHTTLRLVAGSEENRADMAAYLQDVAREPEITAALEQAGVSARRFTDTLVERCAGVWIYLHYVIEEVRRGNRDPRRLEELPQGLWAYYAQCLADLRAETAVWHRAYLPLLATLAAVREHLDPGVLADLAGMASGDGVAGRFVTVTFRPFCSRVNSQYALYHQTLRGFLRGSTALDADQLPEFTVAERAELEEAALTAHRRIAERYLSSWGGLADELPVLAGQPDVALLDGGYGLRQLPVHLEGAGRAEDLHQLLACERRDYPGQAANVWYLAHDRAGRADIYLEHIARAAALAQRAAATARAAGRVGKDAGREIRYHLITASAVSLSRTLSVPLVSALLDRGIWQPVQALAHIANNPDLAARAEAYAALIPSLPEADRPGVRRSALMAAQAIADEFDRARMITRLAPVLTAGLAADMLATAPAIEDLRARAMVLAALAPKLDTEQLPAALAEVQAMYEQVASHPPGGPDGDQEDEDEESDRESAALIVALAALAPRLTPDLAGSAEALSRALRLESPDDLARTASGPAEQHNRLIGMLFESAMGTSYEFAREQSVVALAPCLTTNQADAALEVARSQMDEGSISSVEKKVKVLAAVAPRLTEGQISTALTIVLGIRDHGRVSGEPTVRVHAMSTLASRLTNRQVEAALNGAWAIGDLSERVQAVAALLPALADAERAATAQKALAISEEIADIQEFAEAIAALAPYLQHTARRQAIAAGLERVAAVQEGVAAAREGDATEKERNAAYFDELHLGWALAALAPHLDPSQLQQALDAAMAITDELPRDHALHTLAPYLTPGLLNDLRGVYLTIDDGGQLVATAGALAAQLPDSQRCRALDDALGSTRRIRDERTRAEALGALAPHLTEELLPTAIGIARDMRDDWHRAFALGALANQLTDDLVPGALEDARSMSHEWPRTVTLARLAPRVAPADRRTVVNEALASAWGMSSGLGRAEAVTVLAPCIDPDQLRTALVVAVSTDEESRAMGLVALAPRLGSADLAVALNVARSITHPGARAAALTALASQSQVRDEDRPNVIADALLAAQAISSNGSYRYSLRSPHLSDPQRAGILAPAEVSIPLIADSAQAEAIATLAPWLAPELIPVALATAEAIHGFARSAAVAALALRLPEAERADVLNRARDAAIHLEDGFPRAMALALLVPALAAHETHQALQRALEATRVTSDPELQTTAMLNIAPGLTPEFLPAALEICRLIRDEDHRADAIAKVAERLSHLNRAEYEELEQNTSIPGTLQGLTRASALAMLRAIAAHLSSLPGGDEMAAECVSAVTDVAKWWP
jgi:hypothetical protein